MSKALKTKQYIIEKTAPLFNTKGYEGTSLADMTTATGLTKGSIYGNFSNKDDVALAAFDFNFDKVKSLVHSEMSKYSTCREKLMVYVNVYDDFLKKPFPIGGCPILNTATESDDTHPALRSKANNAVMGWKNEIIQLIKKGLATKEFSTAKDPEETALTMIATIEGAIMITKLTGKINYRNVIMKSVKKMIAEL